VTSSLAVFEAVTR